MDNLFLVRNFNDGGNIWFCTTFSCPVKNENIGWRVTHSQIAFKRLENSTLPITYNEGPLKINFTHIE